MEEGKRGRAKEGGNGGFKIKVSMWCQVEKGKRGAVNPKTEEHRPGAANPE